MTEIDETYIEKMCYEFSRLLYDISEEHQRVRKEWEQKYTELERKCQNYEAQLQDIEKPRILLLQKGWNASKYLTKKLCKAIAQYIFSFGRWFATHLGIKKYLKKSAIFKKLYSCGIIDKLRKEK